MTLLPLKRSRLLSNVLSVSFLCVITKHTRETWQLTNLKTQHKENLFYTFQLAVCENRLRLKGMFRFLSLPLFGFLRFPVFSPFPLSPNEQSSSCIRRERKKFISQEKEIHREKSPLSEINSFPLFLPIIAFTSQMFCPCVSCLFLSLSHIGFRVCHTLRSGHLSQ